MNHRWIDYQNFSSLVSDEEVIFAQIISVNQNNWMIMICGKPHGISDAGLDLLKGKVVELLEGSNWFVPPEIQETPEKIRKEETANDFCDRENHT